MKKKSILIIVIILLVVVFVFSAWKAMDILLEYIKGEVVYSAMDQYVSIPENIGIIRNPALETEETVAGEEPEEPQAPVFPEVDFEALWEENPDVVGWIYIPDTKVNYPILQGEDNDAYLYHLITGEYNSSGSIFLEAGIPGDFSSQNNPIYGHNMKNGSMFAAVTRYKDQEFYDEHPVAYLITPEKNYTVWIFSAYVTNAWGNAWTTSFSRLGFEEWLQAVGKKSYFASDVVPDADDCILTFSTCTYETDDARFVVHGILEEYVENTTE